MSMIYHGSVCGMGSTKEDPLFSPLCTSRRAAVVSIAGNKGSAVA